jgi:hypothetical protein
MGIGGIAPAMTPEMAARFLRMHPAPNGRLPMVDQVLLLPLARLPPRLAARFRTDAPVVGLSPLPDAMPRNVPVAQPSVPAQPVQAAAPPARNRGDRA